MALLNIAVCEIFNKNSYMLNVKYDLEIITVKDFDETSEGLTFLVEI